MYGILESMKVDMQHNFEIGKANYFILCFNHNSNQTNTYEI